MTKPGPKPRNKGSRVLQIRLNDRDYASLEAVANDERMAVAAWARGVLLRYVAMPAPMTAVVRDGELILKVSTENTRALMRSGTRLRSTTSPTRKTAKRHAP